MPSTLDILEEYKAAAAGDNHFIVRVPAGEKWHVLTMGQHNKTKIATKCLIQVFQHSSGRGANLSPIHTSGHLDDINHIHLNADFKAGTAFKFNFYGAALNDNLNYYMVFYREVS